MEAVLQESHHIKVSNEDTLHLRRIYLDSSGPPVFMLHGAIENGRIFYSHSGKGLAPYLARCGFDVYVADLRGRGGSTPAISRASSFGQTEAITEDIPAFIEYIVQVRGKVPQQWVAHSWGGVLLSSFLARFPEHRALVRSLVYFGSKRSVRVKNLHRLVKVDFVWQRLSPRIAAAVGYLPAKRLGMGSDNETARSLNQCTEWVKAAPWVDPADRFDYGAAVRKVSLPPIWYIAAKKDHALGHPRDVHDFMMEAGEQERRYTVLSRNQGNRHDYDHINMLTHPDAVNDHFPRVSEWLRRHGGGEPVPPGEHNG